MKKSKIIMIVLIMVLGILGGIKVLSNRNSNEDLKNKESEVQKDPSVNDSQEEENDSNEINQDLEEDESNSLLEEPVKKPSLDTNNQGSGSNGSKPNDSGNQNKPVEPDKPIFPDKPEVSEPSIPEDPNQPSEEIFEDLIIRNDMLINGTFVVANKKYNTITISSDVLSNQKIVLDSVQIKEKFIIENPLKYQLDIVNSNIPTMVVANKKESFFSLFRSVIKKTINKALDGATINIQDSEINTITVNSNVEINGTNPVSNIIVNDVAETILNIETQNVLLDTQGFVAVNQKVETLVNNNQANIVINAPITHFSNKEESTIRINGNNTISTFYNEGENTVVAGTGNIINAQIEANNTRIYTNVVNKQVNENVEHLLIRQEPIITIVDAYSNAQGSVTFTLSEETELNLNHISVICNAGKSITLFHLTTKDYKTYTLTTSYYKNDSYALYITLPNGNIISKEFATDYANPTVENVKVERISDSDALLKLYGVDEGGKIYYLLEKVNSKSLIDAQTIKDTGTSFNVKVGFNSIPLTELTSDESYQLYYVLEGYYDNISQVKGPIVIPEKKEENNTSDYEIVYAKEEISNRFVFKLNHAPEKELILSDFEIHCPSDGSLTIENATFYVSPDLLTYIIVVPDNYGHKDNEYTVKIKVSENEEPIEKDFVTHLNPPAITGAVDNVKRLSETEAEFQFNSDENGIVYYGLYEWNGGIYDYNSTTPFASDVITGKISSKTQNLYAGSNTIHLDLSGINVTKNTRIWALFVDEVGNYRVGFVDHYKIPEYEKPIPPVESTLEITNIEYTNKLFKIEFNEELLYDITQDDVTFSVIQGGTLPSKLMLMIDNMVAKKVTIEIANYTLPVGEYEIAIHAVDKNNKMVRLVKKIEIKEN